MLPASALRIEADAVSARKGYLPGLDGLRALSISLVLVGHFCLPSVGGVASIGVYLFFLISGFLITRLIIAESKETGRFDIISFYGRRVLRLYPAIVTYLLAVAVSAFLTLRPAPVIEFASVLFYFTNYLISWKEWMGTHGAVLPVGPFWSLSVEEHFYLIMPALFLLIRGSVKKLIFFSIAVCVICPMIRTAYVLYHPQIVNSNILYFQSETRFDSIALGVLLAAACELKGAGKWLRRLGSWPAVVLGLAVVLASLAMPASELKAISKESLRSLGVLPLLCGVLFSNRMDWVQILANSPPAVWLGRISYSLYVWHAGAFYFLAPLGAESWGEPWLALALLVLTFATAIPSYYLVERWFLKLKDKLHRKALGQGALSAPNAAS